MSLKSLYINQKILKPSNNKVFLFGVIIQWAIYILICMGFVLIKNVKKEVYDPVKEYTPVQLKSDFMILRSVMEELHPGLYAYTSKKDYDRLFDSIYLTLNHNMTAIEFRRTLIPLIKAAHCEHTYTNSCEAYEAYINKKALLFPVTIKIFDNKFYIDHNYSSDSNLPKGTEILQVNGKSAAVLANELLHTEGADGDNETKLWWALAHDFKNKYIDFEEDPGMFNLFIKRQGKTTEEKVTLYGLTSDSMQYYKRKRYPAEMQKPKPLALQVGAAKKYAVLTIRSFNPNVYKRYGQDFSLYIDSVIRLLNKESIPNLFIDLRNNNGGYTQTGMELYSHFTSIPFNYIAHIEQKIIKPFKYVEYTDADSTLYKDSAKFVSSATGFFYMKEHELLGIHLPAKNIYTGKIYVLVNGGTMSASAIFCDIIHQNKRAIFIGEEVGGSYTSINGNAVSVTLPATGVAMNIPTRRFTCATETNPHPQHGLIPDHEKKPALKDWLEAKDVEMDYVLHMIR